MRLEPKKTALTIKVALRACGSVEKAAERLGCSQRSLFRWIRQLTLAGHEVRGEQAAQGVS